MRRLSGEGLHDWTNRFALIQLALEEGEVVIPAEHWVFSLISQTTNAETSLLSKSVDELKSIQDFKAVVDAIKPQALPGFDAKSCQVFTSKMPVLPAGASASVVGASHGSARSRREIRSGVASSAEHKQGKPRLHVLFAVSCFMLTLRLRVGSVVAARRRRPQPSLKQARL